MDDKIIVGVAGAGSMGSGIAQVAASNGHSVVLLDSDAASIERAKVNIQKDLAKLVSKSKLTQVRAEEIFNSIKFSRSVEDFTGCGLVIEAIVENADIKKKLFKIIEGVVDSNCILASNTSSLS